jgi:hypothetical protein
MGNWMALVRIQVETHISHIKISFVDRHCLEADPDLDPDADCHQNNSEPHADITPSFTHVGKLDFFYF